MHPPPPFTFEGTICRGGEIDVQFSGQSDHHFLRPVVDLILAESAKAGTTVKLTIGTTGEE